MYIEPNSIIRIMKNVPLDNTYEHTVLFSSLSAQQTYFSSQNVVKHTLSRQSYQRVVKGRMRVEIPSEQLYDCNYLSFQNTAFGSKWFYAFITAVEYVNNACSEIQFEIDVMQTYLFDHSVKTCFVERQHSVGDGVGTNTLPEPVYLGEKIVETTENYFFTDWELVIIATPSVLVEGISLDDFEPSIVNGIFTGGNYYHLDCTDTNIPNIIQLIKDMIGANFEIANVFMCPKGFIDNTTDEIVPELIQSYPQSFPYVVGTEKYIPHNKKLFTYPYCSMVVDNNQGTQMELEFEKMRAGAIQFEIEHSHVNGVECYIREPFYGASSTQYVSREKTLAIKGFPICTWRGNDFLSFIGQRGISDAINSLISFGSSAVGTVRDAMSSITGGGTGLNGRTSGATADMAHGIFGYTMYRKCVSGEHAQRIDEFFDKYGYAQNRLMIPNRNSRPHWNYVKTKDCTLQANAPADDVRKICSIYNSGITFWKVPSEVGNYSLDNTVD